MSNRNLFGGAITANLPPSYGDVSNVRQIPDHQEVFVDNESEASVIVELLQLESSFQDLEAIRHHFQDLADANEATDTKIISERSFTAEEFIPSLTAVDCKHALIGKQTVGKYRTRPDMEVDEVYIILVLVRLANVSTDLLVSMNIPARMFAPTTTTTANNNTTTSNSTEPELNVAQLLPSIGTDMTIHKNVSTMRDFVNSLHVADWGLFC